MLAEQRQEQITRIICSDGKAHINELAGKFGVSGETIRRDLEIICKSGVVKRVHGGAICINRPVREMRYKERTEHNADIKRRIGIAAAKHINDNDIIAIDYGTTANELANAIYGVHNIKIITNSFMVAGILTEKKRRGDFDGSIIFLGGDVNCDEGVTAGVLTVSMLQSFYVDKAFSGATGIGKAGISIWNDSLGVLAQQTIAHAAQVFLIAESEKFGRRSLYTVCPLSSLDYIITDDAAAIDSEILSGISDAGVSLEIVAAGEK